MFIPLGFLAVRRRGKVFMESHDTPFTTSTPPSSKFTAPNFTAPTSEPADDSSVKHRLQKQSGRHRMTDTDEVKHAGDSKSKETGPDPSQVEHGHESEILESDSGGTRYPRQQLFAGTGRKPNQVQVLFAKVTAALMAADIILRQAESDFQLYREFDLHSEKPSSLPALRADLEKISDRVGTLVDGNPDVFEGGNLKTALRICMHVRCCMYQALSNCKDLQKKVSDAREKEHRLMLERKCRRHKPDKTEKPSGAA
ncbi:hypothetical protein BJ508DRAFT_309398 [Ascobolus immersus RN42]|uniref:Uncharacterized protein n=1 Tax=Ascobolus immersus RN42 TaxID=1160509 RepID=A0A3N4HWP4_ASCIM|nr:hypothetical protein BJ508DRAFT_309398 [Ascobolus immersus RN42]